ncbi:serine protease FAM111A-like [Pelmatolapia mariae]|uniref:serine protease FAM111A-like n=1 Tax=Pelmatolapia mariae TaxID=158779 RepID=UPI002FE58824
MTPNLICTLKAECDEKELHKHQFKVKFSRRGPEKYTVYCDQPRTVLEAIKTLHIYEEKIACADENVIIQMGKGDNESSIATHFPCSCIRDDKVLTISCEPEIVGNVQPNLEIHTKDRYSIFYIDKEGGKDTKTKELFKNNAVKQFRYLRVYGEKGITVEEALKRDGRFIDDLSNFKLFENENTVTMCTQKVDNLDNKKFKICLPRQLKRKYLEANPKKQRDQNRQSASDSSQTKSETWSVITIVQQEGISVKSRLEEPDCSIDTDEIRNQLREQFPDLKRLMESRFTVDYFQKVLNLRKENFGKIQQSFSQVHRVRKLLELGKSVCKVIVKDVSMGTGFVLFDTFILTSAHLFKGYVEGKELQQDVEVFAIFDYEEPEPETNFYYFRAENTFIDFDADLDYAVLELNPEGSKPNQRTRAQNIKAPPGLLSKVGPLPANGEACIIGHPAGRMKEMDPTFIIEIEKREQAASDYLSQYKHPLIINTLSDHVRNQGIENILQGGHKAGKIGTYHTFMYHGASGSPVFDGLGRVFGLHTAGFTFGFTKDVESVIEYAHPLIMIFERFVNNLKESENKELLKRVEKEAKGNKFLTKVLNTKQDAPEEQMEISCSD